MSLEMPAYENLGNYLVPTLNKQGWMIDKIVDEYTKEFIEFASKKESYSLEIGAAYGNVSLEVLKNGGKMITNDLDERHLEILYNKTPDNLKTNLKILSGSCTENLDIETESLAGIYCSRVFHFFTSDVILETLKKMRSLLQKEGKIFVVTDSIFHSYNKKNFDNYLRKKFLNMKDAGALKPQEFMIHSDDPDVQEHFKSTLPTFFNLIDIETMCNLFNEAGFITEKVGYFSRKGCYPDESLWDGREGFGIVGIKY